MSYLINKSFFERHLPSKLGGDAPHSDQRLRNDLAAMNIGWSPDLVTTVSERCVKVFTFALIHVISSFTIEVSVFHPFWTNLKAITIGKPRKSRSLNFLWKV